jgi:prepilin signal peptidase PulO-like enzyme (type II secretory pathway)
LVYLLSLLLLTYFGIVTVIDLEHRLILHPVSLVGALLGFAIGVGLHGLRSTLLGGAAGYGIMLLLYFLGIVFIRFITRWRAQEIDEVALGFGDVNLGGVIGLILGWPGIIAGLLLAILLGGFTSLLYLLAMALRRKYRPDLVLPYGPFMVISTVWLLFFRDVLLL